MIKTDQRFFSTKGFTLTELIVVVAIMAVAAMLGTRYYYTDIATYRFQNALTEFKSAVNLARARSLSGVAVGKPLSINIEKINIMGSSIILTPSPNQDLKDLTVVRIPTSSEMMTNPSYVTLSGFCPDDASQKKLLAKNVSFPYWINGPLWTVTSDSSPGSLTLQLAQSTPSPGVDVVPTFNDAISITLNPSTTVPTAYMYVKSVVQIISCSNDPTSEYYWSKSEGHYAKVYEPKTGPSIDFKFDTSKIRVGVALAKDSKLCESDLPGIAPNQKLSIVFDKGLTAQGRTYCVSFNLISGAANSTVNYTILPTGILTQP
jgi:prepilin-type N-terminal cleavage/methylation domain-containing protein